MPSRLSLILAVACLAALLALPAAAAAKIQFGVQAERNGAQTLSQAEVLRMRQGGVKLIRTPLEWELVQGGGPNQAYNFSNFDKLVQWATQGPLPKVKILPILIGSPAWVARSNSNNEPPVTGFDLGKWSAFLRATVNRYKGSGAIKEWQVWNEPNLRTFWTNGKPNPKEYAKLLKISHQAIKGADPSAKVILAGMPERADAPLPMREYLEKLYKVKNFTKVFDAVAVHPFAENEKGVLGGVKRIRKIMDKEGDKKKALWVTEVGFASAGPNSPFTTSPKGQARLLKKTFKALGKVSNKMKVERALWFTWRDSDRDPPRIKVNDRWQTYTGLFNHQGAPKQSWSAFAKEAGGKPGSGNLPPITAAKPESADLASDAVKPASP